MVTLWKLNALALCAASACALLALPVAVSAADQDDDIIVSPDSALHKWQAQTKARLDRALRRAVPTRTTPDDAIVQISFTRGDDGRPENVRFFNDEGGWLERAIAKRAVQSLDNLGEVPVTPRGDVHFLANIIFANDARSHERMARKLMQMEQVRLASAGPASTYVALGY